MCVVQDSFKHWTAARRRIDYPIRECPVWRKATGRSGSKAPIRFLKQRPFDQLFCAWGHQSLSAHFVDFFTAVATTSNVCYALTPVIHDVRFLGHEREVFAASG